MIQFVVPGKPIAKGRPKATTINGRASMYTPAKTVNYEARVALFGAQAMAGRPPLEGPVSLVVTAYFAPPKSWSKKRLAANSNEAEWVTKKPDGDNILKAVSDALNGVCWLDDAQIADVRCIKLYGDERVVVTAEVLA